MEDFSDSGGSSSTGSRTTKHTISAEVVALGEEPIIPSTIKQFFLSLPSEVLPAIVLTIEFVYVGKYCGMANSSLYAFTYPFLTILTKNIPASIAQSCANYAYKNITAGQYAAANIYFAYYFIATCIYGILVLIIGLAALRPFYATEGSKIYYICWFAVFPFVEVFTFACDKFYEVENRIGLVFVKQMISAFTIIGFSPFILNYMNGGDMSKVLGLDCIAYTRCIDYAIEFFWNIVVIGRIKILDVEYFGVLKFSTRRLKPFRPKFLLSVYTNSLASMLINNVFPLCILVLTFILKYIPTTDYELDLLYFKNFLVIIVEQLCMSVHLAFNKSFYLIASYNIGIKKLSRVSQFFKWHLIFDFCFAVPIGIIFFCAARPLTSALIPDIKIFTRYKPHEVDSSVSSVQFTSVAVIFGYLMAMGNSLLEIEQEARLSCILQIPALIYAAATPFISLQIIGETAPLSLILGLVEAVNAVIGLPLIIYFHDRYKGLAKAEELKMKQVEEEAKKAGDVDEIRLTVSEAFERDVEEEDARTAKLKTRMSQEVRLSMTTREKVDKLSNSMAFESLARQFGSSVDRFGGSVLRRSTAAFDEMRTSQMRTSEAADK